MDSSNCIKAHNDIPIISYKIILLSIGDIVKHNIRSLKKYINIGQEILISIK